MAGQNRGGLRRWCRRAFPAGLDQESKGKVGGKGEGARAHLLEVTAWLGVACSGVSARSGGRRQVNSSKVELRSTSGGFERLGSFRDSRGRWLRSPFVSGWNGERAPRVAGERRRTARCQGGSGKGKRRGLSREDSVRQGGACCATTKGKGRPKGRARR